MADLNTRERIIKSALRLFSTKGFLGATTKDIADEAKVAEVTIFRHFGNKELLFEEVLRSYSFLPELQIIIAQVQDMDYEEGMNVLAQRFMAAMKERRDIIRIIQSEVYRYPEKVHVAYHKMIDGFINVLAGHLKGFQDRGILREFDAPYGARAFMGLIFSLFNMQEILLRSKYRKDDERKIIATFINIFVRGTLR